MAGVALADIDFSFCEAGVALADINARFAWQAWRLWRWAGSGGPLGRRWSPVAPRHFAWQAWHLATSTCTLRGRRGAWQYVRSIRVAGVALMHRAGSGGALGRRRRWSLWRRGTVAGVALGNMDVAFAWQAQALVARWGAVGRPWRRGTFHNRQALGDIHLWQAWRLATWTQHLRGRRGTYGTGLGLVARLGPLVARGAAALCMAGVALGDTDLCFAWQARPLPTSTFVLRGSLTHNFVTRNFVTHNLSHTYLSPATSLSHASLSHTAL